MSSSASFTVIQTKKMIWAWKMVRMGSIRKSYEILFGKPERQGPLGRPRSRWEDNIRMDLSEIG
jgi:hypothetical protein